METKYIKCFFELDIKIINENDFYLNEINFKSIMDLAKYLKEVSNSYAEYILKEASLLTNENKESYLYNKINRLKTHSNSLGFIIENFKINTDKTEFNTPFAEVSLEFKNQINQNLIDLFYTIIAKIKVISLKVIFDISIQLGNIKQPLQNKTDKSNLQFHEFEKLLTLINYWNNEDEGNIKIILNPNIDFTREYLKPFEKELNVNLLLKDTFEAKSNLIKYYIFELIDLQGFFNYNKNTIYHKQNENGEIILKEISEVKTDYEKYTILCFEFHNLIFHEIQLCCVKYKINFYTLCDELYFPIHYIDTGITLAFEKMRNENLPPQQTETKTEQEQPKTFIANEYALAYIYDLYASGKQIPVNRTDGGYDKKELIKKGFELYQFDKKKDTFYRAVKHVANFDLNKQQDLVNISQSWIEAVKALSKDWDKTERYLKEKELIGE